MKSVAKMIKTGVGNNRSQFNVRLNQGKLLIVMITNLAVVDVYDMRNRETK